MIWLVCVSLAAVVLTLHDKRAARLHRWRVPENTLLLVSALGGSAAMLFTMLAVRHKTRKARFMVGIPAILLAQLALAGWIAWLQRTDGFPF